MKPLRILVVAGPTREPLDPVRFITNHSTGTMGYALAHTAQKAGHKVTLITGPTHLKHPHGVQTTAVVTAREMFKAVKLSFARADCVVMAAAVSDFRPEKYSASKIKRVSSTSVLKLKKNPDILSWLGHRKGNKLLIGFCMETSNLLDNAQKKMQQKKTDLIVANKINVEQSAFGAGVTTAMIVGPKQQYVEHKNTSKQKLSRILLEKIEHLWYKRCLSEA